ncbi:S-formylglutathione hydrolase FrmB [Catenulispora sp. EB89]|uniref:alpha/beta hydrolase n=1 Tax=Catenulispora sp. EB89 TaxID=3156257 RepID=UPI003516AFEA
MAASAARGHRRAPKRRGRSPLRAVSLFVISTALVVGSGVAFGYATHHFGNHQSADDASIVPPPTGPLAGSTADSASATDNSAPGARPGAAAPTTPRPAPKATGPGTVTTLNVPSADDDMKTRPVDVYRPAVPANVVLPVVYLLHGVPGEPDRMMEAVKDVLDQAFTSGAEAPFIVAAPTGGGNAHNDTEWADAQDGKDMVESYLIKNVIPAVEGNSPRPASMRAIVGFSMGGYGAANLALRHPDLFDQFVSMAGYFHVDDPDGMFGSDPKVEAANTPDDMVQKAAGKRVMLLEDQDETDPLIEGEAAEFAQRLHDCACGVDLSWHLEPGGHSYDFVTGSFPKVITFLDQGFTAGTTAAQSQAPSPAGPSATPSAGASSAAAAGATPSSG